MIRNLVKESASAPGTGTTVTLSGAQTGFVSFAAAFVSSQAVFYLITDGAMHEMQAGQLTVGSPSTLARGTPLWTSTGGAGPYTRLNFTAPVTVYCTLPASHAAYFGTGATPAAGEAVRYDMLGWRLLSGSVIGAATPTTSFSLPSGYHRFRLAFDDVVTASATGLYLRWSTDNMATVVSGATEYRSSAGITRSSSANVTTLSSGGADHMRITLDSTSSMFGEIEFSPGGAKPAVFRTRHYDSSALFSTFQGSGICATNITTPTHVVIGGIGAINMTQGKFRLIGMQA